MAKNRYLLIGIGVLTLAISFGAALLAMSYINDDPPAGATTSTDVVRATENPTKMQSQSDAVKTTKVAQAQTAPQGQPERFPASPGEAANQSGIIDGRGHLKAQHGDWSELCQTASGPGSDRCILVQNIESANRPGFGLAAVVRKVPAAPGITIMMHIYVPLGIYLPKNLGLQIDDQLIGNTPFWSCIPFQCEARVTIPPPLLEKLAKGQRALFAVYENPAKGTVLPISLSGFTAGLNALKAFTPDDAPAAALAPRN